MRLSTVKKIDSLEIVVLAAGKGTRMKSEVPKVLQPICGHPILEIVLHSIEGGLQNLGREFQINKSTINLVVGHGRDQVKAMVAGLEQNKRICSTVNFSVQEQQLGTGHAVKVALSNSIIYPKAGSVDLLMVVSGDLPLLTPDSLAQFVRAHLAMRSSASLMSARLTNAGAYGRVLRRGGTFYGVVEAKDATAKQLSIQEFNGGVYVFDRAVLQDALGKIDSKNAAKEFYLPDVFTVAMKKRKKILAHCVDDPNIVEGVNTMVDLANTERELYLRIARQHMLNGVRLSYPETIRISPFVKLADNVSIDAFSRVAGYTSVGAGSRIGSFCDLSQVEIGSCVDIRNSVVAQNSKIQDGAIVGPMANLRPATEIASGAKIGNFVELKKSVIGPRTNVSHLSYVGDAEIGSDSNVGCGFVTCNYDGNEKHRSIIGSRVFI
ncbi:MAG TPA: bifunctional UDP-N-acetylglucosamine diphosphorylase/glucosamine-1-phosphate N-acetyltransferase GlmU, partial [Oligoflexia bacterium]|nr:bifunctional UDP-N-acetylglucosamine diphosphorylase/glucosamine-1-phosphate N-acetyltransferase GlmU [Oligoflexia bacterium]